MADNNGKDGFGIFASWRIIAGVIACVACLWLAVIVVNFFTGNDEKPSRYHEVVEENPIYKKTDGMISKWFSKKDKNIEKDISENDHENNTHELKTETHETEAHEDVVEKDIEESHSSEAHNKVVQETVNNEHMKSDTAKEHPEGIMSSSHGSSHESNSVIGTAFVSGLIDPIDHELNKRTLGWRPNDLFLRWFTDNVESTQKGVLEVVRRTSEKLVERIAKTGSAVDFDKNLDMARSKFNYNADSYMFPSAEKAYQDGINELKKYRERLATNSATFYGRADRLIPLLKAYEELLGSCDNNLVKAHELNGDPVSYFSADDYFYYSQGVAKAMSSVLHGVLIDFSAVLEPRGATNDLNYVIKELHHASELSPIIILDSDLDGLFANHRANMAAYISHAKAYIQFIIKTMST